MLEAVRVSAATAEKLLELQAVIKPVVGAGATFATDLVDEMSVDASTKGAAHRLSTDATGSGAAGNPESLGQEEAPS